MKVAAFFWLRNLAGGQLGRAFVSYEDPDVVPVGCVNAASHDPLTRSLPLGPLPKERVHSREV
jgi:hypothetical protein